MDRKKVLKMGLLALSLSSGILAPSALAGSCVTNASGDQICWGGSDDYYWQSRDNADGSGYVYLKDGDYEYSEDHNAPYRQ